MASPTQVVSSMDLIAGPDAVGSEGAVRLSRSAGGIQMSVDGAAPVGVGGPPPPGSVPISALADVTGPTALGRTTAGPGPVVQLTPVEILSAVFQRGADIPNANITLQPFTDRAYFYVVPAGTLTANRIITLGIANQAAMGVDALAYQIAIVRLDTSPFTLTIRRNDLVVIHTDPASPPAGRNLIFVCTSAGAWVQNTMTALRL